MPRRYLVRPNQDVVAAEDELEVRISLQSKDAGMIREALREDPDVQKEMKDKFLIQSLDLPEEYSKLVDKREEEKDSSPMSEILASLWSKASAVRFY